MAADPYTEAEAAEKPAAKPKPAKGESTSSGS